MDDLYKRKNIEKISFSNDLFSTEQLNELPLEKQLEHYKSIAAMLTGELVHQINHATAKEHTLLNNIAHGVALFSYDKYSLLLANPALEKQTGFTTDELSTMTLDDILSPKEKRKALKAFAQFKQGKTADAEIELKNKKGYYSWINLSLTPYEVNDNAAVQANIVDITEQKEYDLLKKKLRHDIGSSLNAAIGFTGDHSSGMINETIDYLAKEDYSSVLENLKKLDRFMEIAHGSATNTYDLVQEFGSPSVAKKVSLYNLVENFKSSYEPTIDISIENKVDESVAITTNPLLVYEILQNVTSNAHKYAGEGEKLTITTQVNNNELSLIMRDYGTEKVFNEDDMNKIFETGMQLENGIGKGTGEGLYISAQTAKKLRGSLSVKQLDIGHEFYLTIPLDAA